jgi:hypothetical protein
MAEALGRLRQDLGDRLRWQVPSAARRRLLDAREASRLRSSDLRTLPDLLIIGAQRAGTSSLYRYLRMHPHIAGPLRKEVDYFGFRFERGERWYRANFPLTARRELAHRLDRPFLTFEATPDYLLHPLAARRAHQLLPDARIVVLLRDPVERAISHYGHAVRHGWETLPLQDALAAEEERLQGEIARIRQSPGYRASAFRRYSYVTRGLYADQISRWLDEFPRGQLLVIDSNELYTNPAQALHAVLDFAGLPRWQPAEFRNYSYRTADVPTPTSRSDDLVANLRQRFAPANAELERLLGQSFSWSSSPGA